MSDDMRLNERLTSGREALSSAEGIRGRCGHELTLGIGAFSSSLGMLTRLTKDPLIRVWNDKG